MKEDRQGPDGTSDSGREKGNRYASSEVDSETYHPSRPHRALSRVEVGPSSEGEPGKVGQGSVHPRV